jgi:hypothetical protein
VSKSYLLVVTALIILAGLVVVRFALARSQPATDPQINQVSIATAITRCPPRPTRIPFPTTTPFTETPKPPTPAPPPTPGPPPRIETPVPDATLTHSLETEEEILKVVLDTDMGLADWDDPWCLETPRLEPGRITIKWYPNINAYDGSGGSIYGDEDPRWVVTIKGGVWLRMPGIGRSKSGGAVYFVNQKTGKIYRIGSLAPP